MGSPTQTQLPPSAVAVRLQCLALIAQITKQNITADQLVELAKPIETYAWGLLGPVEKPINPLMKIDEAAMLTSNRLEELIRGMPDGAEKTALREARGTWERFTSQLEAALGQRFS